MGNYDCFVSSILQNSLFNSGFWGQLSNLMLRKLQKGGSKVGEEAAGARWLRNGKKLFWIFFFLLFMFCYRFDRQQQQQQTSDNKVNKIARQGKRDFPLLIAPKRSSPHLGRFSRNQSLCGNNSKCATYVAEWRVPPAELPTGCLQNWQPRLPNRASKFHSERLSPAGGHFYSRFGQTQRKQSQ